MTGQGLNIFHISSAGNEKKKHIPYLEDKYKTIFPLIESISQQEYAQDRWDKKSREGQSTGSRISGTMHCCMVYFIPLTSAAGVFTLI